MALKLNKMEERHQKKLEKAEDESAGEEPGKVEKKKLKNFEK